MGHDHHFLSRLDRVSRDQVDFALELYRDHERVSWILRRANVDRAAERIALAIDHEPGGPHVIVGRDGHFITCLGPGMGVNHAPVLTRGQLDALSREHREQLDRKALAAQLVKERVAHGASDNLFDRIYRGANKVTREEFKAVSAFAPMMPGTFLGILAKEIKVYHETTRELGLVFKRIRKSRTVSSRYTKGLELLGVTYWAMQHTMTLFAMHARELIEQSTDPKSAQQITQIVLGLPFEGALMSSIARSAWAVGKIGRVALPECKRMWEEATSYVELLSSGAAMAALGLRHTRLADEVKKTIAAPPMIAPEDGEDRISKWISNLALAAFQPDLPTKIGGEDGLEAVTDRSLGEWMFVQKSLYEDIDDYRTVIAMLPSLAIAEAEQLYLPRARLQGRAGWDAQDTSWMLDKQYGIAGEAPEKKDGPSRQGPCPCGSGKKYKRCCGE